MLPNSRILSIMYLPFRLTWILSGFVSQKREREKNKKSLPVLNPAGFLFIDLPEVYFFLNFLLYTPNPARPNPRRSRVPELGDGNAAGRIVGRKSGRGCKAGKGTAILSSMGFLP
jgi:hypothetical protein